MNAKFSFSKKDVGVILGCLLFLLVNLGVVGSGGRRRAKEAICAATLKRLGCILLRHANDNNGYFMDRYDVVRWVNTVGPYLKSDRLLLCPEARKTWSEGVRNPFLAWGPRDFDYANYVAGSYVINDWISNAPGTKYWRTPLTQSASEAPMLLDGQWTDMEPYPEDEPSLNPTDLWTPNQNEMQRACISRHNGAVNSVFVDGAVRKVGLKSLWGLKWHREWPEDFPLSYWPYWMENFKEPE